MRRFGSELEFISVILPTGGGVETQLESEYIERLQKESFKINSLSITFGTYIASGFHSFVVKLKNPPPKI